MHKKKRTPCASSLAAGCSFLFVYGDQPKGDEGNGVSGIELAWLTVVKQSFKGNVYGDQPKGDEGNGVSGIELAWLGNWREDGSHCILQLQKNFL
ncbi:MAG: hypothetical protein HFG34_06265 [Eubacterium sp.]|nr:hypothetical protein [Eubacterium sp.]